MFSKLRLYFNSYLARPFLWRDLLRQPSRLLQLTRKREKLSAHAFCEATTLSPSDAFSIIKSTLNLDNSLVPSDFSSPVVPSGFPGGANSHFIFNLILFVKPQIVIETGVGFGISSNAILQALSINSKGYLYSIDRPAFFAKRSDLDIGKAVDTSLRSRWNLFLGVDRDLLPRILSSINLSFPIIFHYDSDKSYFGRSWAFDYMYKFSPKGSILISDDSSDNFSFFDFCKKHSLTPFTLKYNNKFLSFTIL